MGRPIIAYVATLIVFLGVDAVYLTTSPNLLYIRTQQAFACYYRCGADMKKRSSRLGAPPFIELP